MPTRNRADPRREHPATAVAGHSIGDQVDVAVVLMGELRRLAGRGEITFRLPAGSTVHDVARRLRAICEPAFTRRVLTPDGQLAAHVAVFLDGTQLPTARGTPTPLSSGRLELMLVPMHEGG